MHQGQNRLDLFYSQFVVHIFLLTVCILYIQSVVDTIYYLVLSLNFTLSL